MLAEKFSLANSKAFVGQELGVSGWITLNQQRIDQFAECTEDHQWIHVDIERAKRDSPLRTTIAHGYLTLAMRRQVHSRSSSSLAGSARR